MPKKAKNLPKIMIVEDDRDINNQLTKYLTFKGYQVSQAFNGQEGIEVLEKLTDVPNILLCDYKMPPGINGFEFLSKIKTEEKYKDMYVVGIGDFPSNETQYLNDRLRKPFGTIDLINCIEKSRSNI